jgi:hydroxysqualene dehydroxylase
MKHVAVIGAGWAGAAAALTLARAGIKVTVFEATKSVGGRARVVDKDGREFDNGQHLMLGAYDRSLALIGSLHGSFNDTITRTPLALNTAPRVAPSLRMQAPNVAAPLHLLLAIATTRGLSVGSKLSTLVWAAQHLRGRIVSDAVTVSEILAEQPEPPRRLLWEPLCIAALNTLPEVASARVFVEVLRRAFTGNKRASDLIIPRVDLTRLLPEPAMAEVIRLGGEVQLRSPVLSVSQNGASAQVAVRGIVQEVDRVVIATGPQHVSRLLGEDLSMLGIARVLGELKYEPITTLYFEFDSITLIVNSGMLMLSGDPGQWLFWQQLPNGVWRASVVISAHHRTQTEAELIATSLAQLRQSYQLPDPIWHVAITEKRATYACTPNQVRMLTDLPKRHGNILFAGDWCYPVLPATLEAAVISGENAAREILNNTDR